MAEIKVEREPGYRGQAPQNVWPIWLAGALGVAGLLAVLTMSDVPATRSAASVTTSVAYQGQALSSAGASAVGFVDGQMVKVGTSREGIELYRHRAQVGGGGGTATSVDPVYMKVGANTYLRLAPLKR